MSLERSIAWPMDLVVYQQPPEPNHPLTDVVVLFDLHIEEIVFGSKPLGNTIIKL